MPIFFPLYSKYRKIRLSTGLILLLAGLAGIAMPDPAHSCTLSDMQANLAKIGEIMRLYNVERLDYLSRRQEYPPLREKKRNEMLKTNAHIRSMFANEIAQNPDIAPDSPLNDALCAEAAILISANSTLLASSSKMAGKSEKPQPHKQTVASKPHCKANTIRKRFGKALRKQRALRIAGMISKKEHIEYLALTTLISKNLKNNFTKACASLDKYEKRLSRESRENNNNSN